MSEIYYRSLLKELGKNKRLIMNKKLEKMDGLTAEQILELYGDVVPPINIEKILDLLGVKYNRMDFSQLENTVPDLIKKRGRILGAVTVVDDGVNIVYSSDSTDSRIRFTLAHELAHCCQNASAFEDTGHVEFRFDEKSDNPAEIAANIFAGKLLVPKEALLNAYNEMIVPLSDVLAKKFEVSTHVMEARLRYLKLPYYSPNGAQSLT